MRVIVNQLEKKVIKVNTVQLYPFAMRRTAHGYYTERLAALSVCASHYTLDPGQVLGHLCVDVWCLWVVTGFQLIE